MKQNALGASPLQVSQVCLGTMTFGRQNSEAEAHAQLDYAFERGINFVDTAEMYPVPPSAEHCGKTEAYVGSWLQRQDRSRVILATKATGPGRAQPWIRGGSLSFDRANLRAAIEGSLTRLRTDYVDLYQLHWPDRNTPMFGKYRFEPEQERDYVPLLETLQALAELQREGKIRHWGLSNETPWGLMSFLRLADEHGLPRPLSVQNAYSLVNRNWESGLAEIGYRERVSLLAYSPLAFSLLSGKYLENPAASGRATAFPGFIQRYDKPAVARAVAAYTALARAHGLKPAQMALAFVYSRWFVGSTIIGATSLEQLRENIDAAELSLAPELFKAIEAIHLESPNPAP